MTCATALAYYEQLPEGWASFPDCVARASLLRDPQSRGTLDVIDMLPAPLGGIRELLASASDWLPEVVVVGALLAVRDANFGEGTAEDEAFLAWLGQLNRGLLAEPGIANVVIADPTEVLPRLPRFWEMFHRGTPLTIVEHSESRARLVLTYPRRLFHPINLESHRRALGLSLAQSRAMQPRVDMRQEVSGDLARSVFEVSWH